MRSVRLDRLLWMLRLVKKLRLLRLVRPQINSATELSTLTQHSVVFLLFVF